MLNAKELLAVHTDEMNLGHIMGKLSAYIFTTLNGYFESPKGNISWHTHGEEENDFAKESIKPGGMMLFGRVTYEMMASWWPTPEAIKTNPIVAKGMNKADKIVFSRTLQKAEWNNTRLIRDNIFEDIQKLKDIPGRDMTILGSGSIITQFAERGMLDSFQIMIDPVVLGSGTPIFQGLKEKLNLKLTSSRVFKSGVILLNYVPVKK
jgi:dihydrofolate reductase